MPIINHYSFIADGSLHCSASAPDRETARVRLENALNTVDLVFKGENLHAQPFNSADRVSRPSYKAAPEKSTTAAVQKQSRPSRGENYADAINKALKEL